MLDFFEEIVGTHAVARFVYVAYEQLLCVHNEYTQKLLVVYVAWNHMCTTVTAEKHPDKRPPVKSPTVKS